MDLLTRVIPPCLRCRCFTHLGMGMFQNNSIKSKKSQVVPEFHEVEIVYSGPKTAELRKITCSKDCEHLLRQIFDERKLNYKESFHVILLNRANNPIACSRIGEGSTTGVVVNLKEIFQLALLGNACGIIIAHNHPSGNSQPSEQDNILTQKVRKAAEMMDISLLDHIILAEESYYSYSDHGLL